MSSRLGAEMALETAFREKSRPILAHLARISGDLDIAEDTLQDACAAALSQWPVQGVPSNPAGWLLRTAKFKAIDRLRAAGRTTNLTPAHEDQLRASAAFGEEALEAVDDEVLRLVFTCCHPSIAPESQIALTLREVCGLTTEEIARAFLTPVPTVAQRIVRAKAKIREAVIPFESPAAEDLPGRLPPVLRTVYLVFNEGYAATTGDDATRLDLVAEALRLARLLARLVDHPETHGLLALMTLHEARRTSRFTADGDIILLEDQDRSLWDRGAISEASLIVQSALRSGRAGPYALQAAILAVHAGAPSFAETDWEEIVGLYGLLWSVEPSPVVELNRAVALSKVNGPKAGLEVIGPLIEDGPLSEYHPAYAARAALKRESGDRLGAYQDYERALRLARQEPERRFLQARMQEISTASSKPVENEAAGPTS